MDPWLARAEQLCYEGEEIEEEVRLGEGGVVVTTHRVLAFAPAGDDKPFQEANRPNVEGVRRSDAGTVAHLVRAIKALVLGGVLIVVGFVLDLEGVVGDVELSGGGAVGLGGVLGLLQQMLAIIAMLDDLMVVGGTVALMAAAALFGVYLWTRESTLIVDVAGGDELAVPTEGWPEGDDVIARLDRAIAPGARGSLTTGSRGSAGPPSDDDPLA